jgi:HEAT repeat protein
MFKQSVMKTETPNNVLAAASLQWHRHLADVVRSRAGRPCHWLAACRTFATLFSLILVLGVGVVAGQQKSSTRTSINRLAQQSSKDAASVMFQSGRDLINDQQWSKAEEKFREFSTSYPKEKNLDAALYWMAYAEFQLSKFDQCKSTLNRLLNQYQNSSWKEDARTLYAQLPGGYPGAAGSGSGFGVGVGVGGNTPNPPAAAQEPGEPYTVIVPGVTPRVVTVPAVRAYAVASGGDDWEKGSDDDPCEFKIVVLQALFQSDVQRGISAATEWLNTGSTQTVRCKGAALSLLAKNGGKAVTPVILGVAQREADMKLRTRAISALGITSDETVIDPLRDFALNSQESSIVEAALYALGQHSGPRAVIVLGEIAMSNTKPTTVRRIAISSIASRPGEPSVDTLLKIYDSDQTVEIRKATIAGFSHRKSERAGNKMLEIARTSDNIELRKAAISGIATRSGAGSLDTLLSLYDSEKNEELKDRIINAVGGINDTRVTRKLIEIARNPQSPIERRKRAIGWLSRSKDPEVTTFLENLLK